MIAKPMFAALLWVLAVAPALAQDTSRFNVLGTIERVDASSVAIKDEQGGAVETFKLAPHVMVTQNEKASLADIRPNDFVASAAVRGTDGKLHSTELRIFPDAMRGVGEGQRPMNDARHQTMTNATVTGAAVVNGSNNVRVRFAGGDSELIVDPGVPITRLVVADRSLLKSGVRVRVLGTRGADGATADRIMVQ